MVEICGVLNRIAISVPEIFGMDFAIAFFVPTVLVWILLLQEACQGGYP